MKKLTIIFIVLPLFFYLQSCNQKGNKLKMKNGELFYTHNADKETAQKLGSYLTQQNFFGDEKKSVRLDKKGDTWIFMMTAKKGTENDEQYLYLLGFFANQLSADVFSNEPVDIHLCDSKLETIRVVNFKCDPSGSKAP